jgi:hypothetical protein
MKYWISMLRLCMVLNLTVLLKAQEVFVTTIKNESNQRIWAIPVTAKGGRLKVIYINPGVSKALNKKLVNQGAIDHLSLFTAPHRWLGKFEPSSETPSETVRLIVGQDQSINAIPEPKPSKKELGI